MIVVSTGESWGRVAEAYSKITDEQIAGADLGSVLKAAVAPEAPRAQVIEDLLVWLQGEVRYTGVEFGEAAIVPRRPEETLERRYGDCKDKATLLAALLRASGIPAYLALLRTGPGFDVHPELPGLGFFDHAIVYIPGEQEIWIDPTAELARAGELPPWDQGRYALVARPETQGLVVTPAASSNANRFHEIAHVELAEFGPARSKSVTEAHGAIEYSQRSFFDSVGPDVAERLAENEGEEGILSWYMTDPRDLSEPFRLELEMAEDDGGFTDLAWAEARLDFGSLLELLPDVFVEEDAGAKLKDRTEDLLLTEPYTAEMSVRVVPPAGFHLVELPPREEMTLGPATFVRELRKEPDGAVAGRLWFDTGKRRLTADEARALRYGVLELLAEPRVLFRFEHRGESLLAAGQVEEALHEFRSLPPDPLNRSRIARALLAAGLGEAGRREARAAAEAGPDLAMTWHSLALALIRDPLGRPFAPGWDQAGAEEAFRKALELAPDLPGLLRNLAVALEYDASGQRYGAGARLDEAIEIYRRLRQELGHHDLDLNLLVALFYAGRYQEAADLAREISQKVMLVAVVAAAEGPSQARAKLRSLSVGDTVVRKTLQEAASLLLTIRRYPEAAALFEASAQGAPNAALLLAQAEQLRKARPHEELLLDLQEPVTVAHRVLQAQFLDDPSLLPPLAPQVDAEDLLPVFRFQVRSVRNLLATVGLPEEPILDALLANATVDREGEPGSGYRLKVTWSFSDLSLTEVVYTTPGPDGYELVSLSSSGELVPLAAQASARLDDGDLGGARRWLGWARRECADGGGDPLDPLSLCPLAALWEATDEPGPESLASLTATLLAQTGSEPALEHLLQRWQETEAPARRRAYGVALAGAYGRLERFEALARVAADLLAAYPESETAFGLLAMALNRQGRWSEVEEVAEERLDRLPGDLLALRALASAAESQGVLTAARKLWLDVVGSSGALSADFNNLAWGDVCLGQVDDSTKQHAEQAVLLSGQTSSASLHTMATVYAELGKITQSRDLLYQSIDAPDSDGLEPHHWYVLGRIAEHLGLSEEARRAYHRVEPPELEIRAPVSTFTLAARRLAALGETDGQER